jgi:phage gp36-like protein
MPYTTEVDLKARYGETEITQLVTDGKGIDGAITAADALINSYLTSGGYVVPLDPVPASIAHASQVVTRYNLWEDAASEEVRQRYKDTIDWLKDIARGRAKLGDTDADAEVPASGTLKVAAGASSFDWDGY